MHLVCGSEPQLFCHVQESVPKSIATHFCKPPIQFMLHRLYFRFSIKKTFGKPAYIVALRRTPIGSYMGKLSRYTAIELAALTVKNTVTSINLDPKKIDEVLFGCALQAGIGQAPARQAALRGGVNVRVPCTTINKGCASGMKAVMLGAQSIGMGYNNIVLAGGFESMSNAPFYITDHRKGISFGQQKYWDAIEYDAFVDAFSQKHIPLGIYAEKTVRELNMGREAQDDYALLSYSRALQAYRSGKLQEEIIPLRLDQQINMTQDEQYIKINKDQVRNLKPMYMRNGTITQASTAKLGDGAAVLILMSEEQVTKLPFKPLAKILGYCDASIEPQDFCLAPTKVIHQLVSYSSLNIKDIDLFEINQNFSATVLATLKLLNIPIEKTNVFGGALSLCHPIGMSGTRIIQTLLTALRRQNGKYGIASIANGSGGASAILLQNLRR